MVHTTSEFYNQFTSTISTQALKKWTKEITFAEAQRLKDPHVMDIMGARQPDVIVGPPESVTNSNRTGNQWLSLALSIEEKQYIFILNYSITSH